MVRFVDCQTRSRTRHAGAGEGPLTYTSDTSYDFRAIDFGYGGGTVASISAGTVERRGDMLHIRGEITSTISDVFTDPLEILDELGYRTSELDDDRKPWPPE